MLNAQGALPLHYVHIDITIKPCFWILPANKVARISEECPRSVKDKVLAGGVTFLPKESSLKGRLGVFTILFLPLRQADDPTTA